MAQFSLNIGLDPSKRPTDNDTRTWDQKRDDFIAVTVWSIMLFYALISNILIIIGIARSTTMRIATSYWFIISLAICDIVMVIISLVHLVPATAFHGAFLEFNSIRNVLMIFFYDFFWYTAVLQLGLMACNRFVSIVYPMEYKWLFSSKRSLLIIFFGYMLGLIVSLPSLFPCCHTLWNSDFYVTVYEPMDTWYKYVDMSVNSLSLIMMIFSYAVIIYKVRKSNRAMAKYQLTIRSKFFVVSVVFLLTWTTWQWLPYMFESKWAYFAMTSLFFINNSINPTVYLIFNTQLRRELDYLLCSRTATNIVERNRRRSLSARPLRNDNTTDYNSPTGTRRSVTIIAHNMLPSKSTEVINTPMVAETFRHTPPIINGNFGISKRISEV